MEPFDYAAHRSRVLELINRVCEAGFDLGDTTGGNPVAAGIALAREDMYGQVPPALDVLERFDRPNHRWDMPDCFGPLLRVVLFEAECGTIKTISDIASLLEALAGKRIKPWIAPLTLAALGFPGYRIGWDADEVMELLVDADG